MKLILNEKQVNETINITHREQRILYKIFLFDDVLNDTLKQTVKDCYNAHIRYFRKLSGRTKKSI